MDYHGRSLQLTGAVFGCDDRSVGWADSLAYEGSGGWRATHPHHVQSPLRELAAGVRRIVSLNRTLRRTI